MNKIKLLLCISFIFIVTGCKDDEVLLDAPKKQNNETIVKTETENNSEIYVYIKGAVKHPGVYRLSQGDRLFQLVKLAGGMKKTAKKDYLNLAEVVNDGDSIRILTKKEYKKHKKKLKKTGKSETSIDKPNSNGININTASEEELTNLSGIGPSKAKAIVEYRNTNGSFKTIEELKKVSGIGEATYNNISKDICV